MATEIDSNTIKLIENLNVSSHTDKPAISRKRPFGNSDYYIQVLDIIETDETVYEDKRDRVLSDRGREIVEMYFERVKVAMKILFANRSIETGTYKQSTSGEWIKEE